MHFHLPKPLHGWRQFVGEVGIIVVGVLIALSAEQLVETMHWHHAVDAARDSLYVEIEEKGYDAAELAIAQPCIDRQLQLLEQAVLAPGPYQPVPAYSEGAMTFAFRAPSRPWSNHIWQSVNNDGTVAHFDPKFRLGLARLYGLLDSMRADNAVADTLRWRLAALTRPIQPDAAARAGIVTDIEQARGVYAIMALVADQIIGNGEGVGFRPKAEDLRADGSGTLNFCRAHRLPLGKVQPKS